MLPGQSKYVVAIKRTNWEFGKTQKSIMYISLVNKNISLSVCRMLLDKKGFSNHYKRIELLNRLFEILPKKQLANRCF